MRFMCLKQKSFYSKMNPLFFLIKENKAIDIIKQIFLNACIDNHILKNGGREEEKFFFNRKTSAKIRIRKLPFDKQHYSN